MATELTAPVRMPSALVNWWHRSWRIRVCPLRPAHNEQHNRTESTLPDAGWLVVQLARSLLLAREFSRAVLTQ
jgi:hypothetical protein